MLGTFYHPGSKRDMNGARIDIIIQNEDANIANNERIRVRFIIKKPPFILFPIL